MTDGIGAARQPFVAFNLQALKTSKALEPVLFEVFHRTSEAFKSEELLEVPKWIDIDEARWLLGNERWGRLIEAEFLTARKHGYGLSLWSQSPQHFLDSPCWHGIKSAATCFFFLRDPTLNQPETVTLYRDTFDLSLGECEAIKRLALGEALLKVPHLNLSKVVILHPEPASLAMTTSTPREVRYRNERLPALLQTLDPLDALDRIQAELDDHARLRRSHAA
jgi:hypothetical protein